MAVFRSLGSDDLPSAARRITIISTTNTDENTPGRIPADATNPTPKASPALRRAQTLATNLGRYLASVPVSIAFAVVIVIAAVLTGTAFGYVSKHTLDVWGTGVQAVFTDGQWWTVFSALSSPTPWSRVTR